MMEALEQQPTNNTSNSDGGGDESGTGAGAGAGTASGGGSSSEEDELDDSKVVLDAPKAEMEDPEKKGTTRKLLSEKGKEQAETDRQQNSDSDIKVSMANGQASSSDNEKDGSEKEENVKDSLDEEKQQVQEQVIEADVKVENEVDLTRLTSDPVKEENLVGEEELLPAPPVPNDEDSKGELKDEVFNSVSPQPQTGAHSASASSSDRSSPVLAMDVDVNLDQDLTISSKNYAPTDSTVLTESIKVESEPNIEGDKVIGELSLGKITPKSPITTTATIKLNGAHETLKEESNEEQKQPTVIAQKAAVSPAAVSPPPPPHMFLPIRRDRSKSISSQCSSVSSASQPQLVIDHHPESEQNVRVQPLKIKKRRRSSQSSSSQILSQPNEKQIRVNSEPEAESLTEAEPQPETSLLMQRLQGQMSTLSASESATLAIASASTTSPLRLKKERFFRCARCNSVHQCWNFFLHMREVHQRYICLYCSHVYASVEKLSLHLENKHDIDQSHFATRETWVMQQQQQDRPRYLICCTCQSTFDTGSRYEDHDCTQLMQPCALCGEKGCHALGCRNTKKKPPPPRRRKKARKAQTAQDQNQLKEIVSNPDPTAPQMDRAVPPEGYIPAPPILSAPEVYPYPRVSSPAPQSPPPALPKLVVPKIMLRVPKEFQKSVDATLSSTDTEDETEEVPNNEPLPSCSPPLPQPEMPSNHLPLSSDPLPPPADEDSPTAKLSRVLAEIERTKLDIERTKADIYTKKQAKVAPEPPQVAPPEIHHQQQPEEQQRRWSLTPPASPPAITIQSQPDAVRRNSLGSDCMDIDESMHQAVSMEQMQLPERDLISGHHQQAELEEHPQQTEQLDLEPMQLHNAEEYQPSSSPPPPSSPLPPSQPAPPADGIDVAGPETHTVDLQLDRPLDKISMVDLVRLCMKMVYPFCLYCNHARRIAVNGKQLVLHMIGEHRFTATVDSITAEELHAETIVAKLKSFLPLLETEYLNLASCCSVRDENGEAIYVEPFNERIYECFTCRFVTSTHKELYTHNRRLHIKSNIMCSMCRSNFFSYSEILCHICPGRVTGTIYALQFRCCLCEMAPLPSAFRLMVHLRKQHQACDICLEDCHSQAKLSSHVWKHKLLHLCYRCGIAYRNKQDISKHLFWKHGTESANCKRCLQKRWRHVYHFCVPPTQFPCEHCGFIFSKAIYLEVHKRMHTGDFRYPCTAVEACEEKFVSRKLLMKHLEAEHVEKEHLPAIEDVPLAAENECAEPVAKEDDEKMAEIKSKQPESPEIIKVERERQRSIEVKVESEPEPKMETIDKLEDEGSSKPLAKSEQTRKRRKKSKRNKESLEDLNLIAPNLSESDSSSDSDSDAPRSNHDMALPIKPPPTASVDDLDMPKVMLSPSSESDNDGETQANQLLEKEKKEDAKQQQQDQASDQMPKTEPGLEDLVTKEQNGKDQVDAVPDIWKNLLQNQAPGHRHEQEEATADDEADEELQQPPNKLHVVWSDHDYCKMRRTPPPPSPVKQSRSAKSGNERRISGNSSESDSSSSSSSNSDSDSSSCSCGTNCTCSSSNSSSSSDDSDDSDSSNGQSSPQKQQRSRKKSLKQKKIDDSLISNELDGQRTQEEEINVTIVSEDQPLTAPDPVPGPPSPKLPMYNESDFDTTFSETDEEFYDAHPQKLATELLTQNRETVNPQDSSLETSNNYGIVENSRTSTPSLPEEAAAFAERRERVRNKKKKRERKSSCKSGRVPPGIISGIPSADSNCMPMLSSTPMEPPILPMHSIVHTVPVPLAESPVSLLPMLQTTPLTHLMQPGVTRMSEGSSCSDADGQLKRSKRQRRPNKFYGYTSDDENMTTILAPPLQVGMQLIKPQPPPQLTWAKEDLPTPPKQRHRTSNNNNNNNHHLHSNGCGTPLASSGSASGTRKRSSLKQRNLMSSANRSAKRQKLDRDLPPIPTLKIRPGLLTSSSVAPPSDSSDSSTEDEDTEINVTTLPPCPSPSRPPPPIMSMPIPVAQPSAVQPTLPPPPPATATAFNQPIPPALLPNPDFATLQYFKANNIRYPIRPPAGARLAREGESVYCYCRCPYDEVSEMIACDGDNCLIEWFHFECVGIMVAPQGKWFCAECRPKYSEGLYAGAKAK